MEKKNGVSCVDKFEVRRLPASRIWSYRRVYESPWLLGIFRGKRPSFPRLRDTRHRFGSRSPERDSPMALESATELRGTGGSLPRLSIIGPTSLAVKASQSVGVADPLGDLVVLRDLAMLTPSCLYRTFESHVPHTGLFAPPRSINCFSGQLSRRDSAEANVVWSGSYKDAAASLPDSDIAPIIRSSLLTIPCYSHSTHHGHTQNYSSPPAGSPS